MLVCRSCYGIFRTDRLVQDGEGIFYCPSSHCGNIERKYRHKLCDIDDLLIDVCIQFWKEGVDTRASCSGHLWKTVFQPYIVFEIYEDSFADYFQALLNDGKLDSVSIDTVKPSENEDNPGVGSVTVECSEVFDGGTVEKIELQHEFLLYLYAVLDKHRAKRSGNG